MSQWKYSRSGPWLVVSFIVHLLLLTVEVLRDDSVSLLLGFIVCILFATLRASLPKIHDQGKRNISLALSALIIGIGIFRLVSSSLSVFDIWMHAWTIIPSSISLWLAFKSSRYCLDLQQIVDLSDRIWFT